MKNINTQIWDKRYADGEMFWYPYDIAIRLVRSRVLSGAAEGIFLDHGFGSGNHLEFLTRIGLAAIGTEVSQAAISAAKHRFAGAKLTMPETTLINPENPLAGQLPRYDHLFSWLSVCYNRKAKCAQDIKELIDGMKSGGHFILAIPSSDDLIAQNSELEPDGTYRIVTNRSGQQGALITLPKSKEELLSWCDGIDVKDCATYGWTLSGERVEHYFVYGVKP